MRLINNFPIISFTNNLSRYQFGLSKTLCGHGELLKSYEQRLVFLKSCKRYNLYPQSIDNNIVIRNRDMLFPRAVPGFILRNISKAKRSALNQQITEHYLKIAYQKAMIAKTQILIKECPTSYQYLLIQSVFTKNNEMMKQSEKARLKNKFDWLFNKQRELGISNSQNTGFEEPIVEPLMERITPIQVELTPDEQSVLALGPNFALTPRIDDKLITNVQVEVASSAYQLRWRKHMEEVQGCRTHAQHLTTLGTPISKSYVHPPPNNNTEVEDNLTRFNNFVIHLYKNSKIDFNLTPSQAAGLKSLIRKKDELHFSVSDKGGEFVIIDKAAHRNLTEHHITSTEGVYKYILRVLIEEKIAKSLHLRKFRFIAK